MPEFLLKNCPWFYKNEPVWRISRTALLLLLTFSCFFWHCIAHIAHLRHFCILCIRPKSCFGGLNERWAATLFNIHTYHNKLLVAIKLLRLWSILHYSLCWKLSSFLLLSLLLNIDAEFLDSSWLCQIQWISSKNSHILDGKVQLMWAGDLAGRLPHTPSSPASNLVSL